MTPQEFQALPSEPADFRYTYGSAPEQFIELRVPTGRGKWPVAILIHGGCFQAQYATLRDLAPIADALRAKGVATWNVEYRRSGNPGGGWPGTYLDAGQAVDAIRSYAEVHSLDLSRTVIIGHSAGGHLAMWVAARRTLPPASEFHVEDPLQPLAVFNLAGAPDLAEYLPYAGDACGPDKIHGFLGGEPRSVPERYQIVSVTRRLPIGIPQILVWGEQDPMIPLALAVAHRDQASKKGDRVALLSFPDEGHFEVASPLAPSWPTIEAEILSRLHAVK
ncbi:MAG: alpha/beta hydrolase [Opitutaceae bacterium]